MTDKQLNLMDNVDRHAIRRHAKLPGNHRSRVTMPGYHRGRCPGNKGKTYPAEPLTLNEMRRLLAATGNGYAGVRDRALYTVLWRTGLRISEALALRPKDVDLEAGHLTVLHGKNDKRRMVGFDPRTAGVLSKWIAKRGELDVGRDKPVFCVISKPTIGKPLYSSCVREQLRDCAARAGIDRLLGHSNSATTARYIDHINPQQALDVARAREWGDEQ